MKGLLKNDKGFTFIVLLFIIVIASVMIGATGKTWSNVMKREREAELIFVGLQYVHAIEAYYTGSLGQHKKMYPSDLKNLLEDPRERTKKRYLRTLYKDPMTGLKFVPIKDQVTGKIKGVKSSSKDSVLKTAGFPDELKKLNGKSTYNDWEFVFEPKKTSNKKTSVNP